ncbi:prion-like-(Q/N-rich) domain-bearing protein 25 [Microplitis mediator]|uniref:prion-like-(Q/N-rich) domain-bearing protein 25 n=1 Tax=Microplitis mediator TaxID=375433 RepID=UPI0025550F4E|nr:prion-like-(Q/N-rich) domain-bearing protein 25 [Microplitis mediator]
MFAMCSLKKRCVCEDKYKQLNETTCTPILGGLCSKNEQCNVVNSVCMNNQCRCNFLFVELSPEKCIPLELGLPCRDHGDCKLIDNSECSKSKKCVCKVDHFPKTQRQCNKSLKVLGSPCDTDTDCNDIKYAKCSDLYRCDCQSNYIKFNTTTCIQKHDLISKSCSADCECKEIKNSHCSENNKCICGPNNFAINSLECKSLFNGTCSDDTDCVTINSVCIENRCQCKVYYAPESNEKCLPILLGSPCRNYFDCQALTNAVCSKNKICVCAEDSYAISNSTCLPVIGSYCNFDINCLSDLINCVNNRCQCKNGYVSISESQCVKRESAYQCQNTLECGEPWHSVCSEEKVCSCKANNYAANKSTCSPQITGYCFLDHQCMVKDSVCDYFRCKCKPNFRAIANNLCLPV